MRDEFLIVDKHGQKVRVYGEIIRYNNDSTQGLLNFIIFRAYIADMEQDIPVWNHKVYQPNPKLAKGDGPIHLFRKFASQF